ncbi:MAG: hypothetical protein ACRBCI_03780 [Cellvibrionaceae bacterium]
MKFLKNKLTLAVGSFLAVGSGLSHAGTTINPYGFVQADFIYSTDQDTGTLANANAINTDPNFEEDARFQAYAITSRLGLNIKGDGYSAVFEGDYFGGSGGTNDFRLRLAYGQYGNVTAGQAYSTATERDWIAYPTTLDFYNPAGLAPSRLALLRYTVGNVDLGIENSSNLSLSGGGSTRSELPDFVIRYASKGDSFSWYASAVAASSEVDGGAADGDSVTVVGAHGGMRFNAGSGGAFSANVIHNSPARANYGGAVSALVVDGTDVESVDRTSYVVAWQGKAGPKTSYNIAYGQMKFDDEHSDLLGAGTAETLTTIHANILYSPIKNVTYGFEISNVEREDFSGDSADNTRLQFSAKYAF